MQRRRWANGRARPGLPGLVLLALALLAPALLQTPAAAQSAGSVYTVTDIAINKQAQTGAAAPSDAPCRQHRMVLSSEPE